MPVRADFERILITLSSMSGIISSMFLPIACSLSLSKYISKAELTSKTWCLTMLPLSSGMPLRNTKPDDIFSNSILKLVSSDASAILLTLLTMNTMPSSIAAALILKARSSAVLTRSSTICSRSFLSEIISSNSPCANCTGIRSKNPLPIASRLATPKKRAAAELRVRILKLVHPQYTAISSCDSMSASSRR